MCIRDSILVTQTLSLGIEKIKPMLFEELLGLLREDGQTIRGIYERNDVGESLKRKKKNFVINLTKENIKKIYEAWNNVLWQRS